MWPRVPLCCRWGTGNLRNGSGMVQNELKIIGSYFFSDPTVNGEKYKTRLPYYATPKMLDLSRSPVFHGDGTPPHWAIDVPWYLDTELLQWWIWRLDTIAWPAKSPDLTFLDIACGAMCEFMYFLFPCSLCYIWRAKGRIDRAIAAVSTQTFKLGWKYKFQSYSNHKDK